MTRFMRPASFQYVGGNTFVHRVDPRAKFIFFLTYSVTLALSHRLSSVIVLSLILTAAFLASGLSLITPLRNLSGIFTFCILFGGLEMFIQRGGRVVLAWGPLQVTEDGLVTAAVFTLKIICFICIVTLFSRTTHPVKLKEGLRSLLSPLKRVRNTPEDFIFMLTLAFNYIPFLAEEIDRIAMAQKARGKQPARWNLVGRLENLLTMLVPIFDSTLRRAETMAWALEARGYNAGKHVRPPVRKRLSLLDSVTLAAALLLPFILFISV